MKKFNITVNGASYQVEVEEVIAAPAKAAAPAATEPTDVTIVSDVPALEGLPTLPRGN